MKCIKKNDMSPNACVHWSDEKGLLYGYPGESELEEPTFTWTYSIFEEIADDLITPSMYDFMAVYVQDNISKESLYEIQGGDYQAGKLEEEAVDAYYDLPLIDRVSMHDRALANLRAERNLAEEKKHAAMDWIMDDEDTELTPENPIYVELCQFVRSLVQKNNDLQMDLERRIQEEEQWRGGHEAGMSDDEGMYDPMEE